jgi:osmoprotectant transport system permease protein
VDRDVVEAASGMGMGDLTMIRKVELPLATPLVVNGVRLAAVQIVATATIAALVGGGGLGRIITSGFGRQDTPALVSGAILVAVFAVAVEGVFALLQRRIDPTRGHDGGAARGEGAAPGSAALGATGPA